jgi:pantoate kinase
MLKVGDTVKRCDGATDYRGKPFATEGVIKEIRTHAEGDIYLIVARNGDLSTNVVLRPEQVKKINKKFNLHNNGKMKLFREVKK